jgi:hypothetical protein
MADIEQLGNGEQPGRATPPAQPEPDGEQPVEAYYRGLEGVSGAMRIDAPAGALGTLFVADGTARFVSGASAGTARAFFEDPSDIRPLLRGELNPVVAGLQRRIIFGGDRALGARIVLGLHTGPLPVHAQQLHTAASEKQARHVH